MRMLNCLALPVVLTLACWMAARPAAVQGDVIRLINGGELRGTLRPGHTRDAQVTIETLTGATVTVERSDIQFTTVRKIEVEHYEQRLRSLPETADAHWELAEWCREQRLLPQRGEQLQAVVAIDPDHAEARRALGHIHERGEWMTREEHMAGRGYFLHNGKYVTSQELELLEKNAAQREAEKEWYKKLALWVRWMTGNNDRQRQQAVAHLKAIKDPAAIGPLSKHLGNHDQTVIRAMYVDILIGIGGVAVVEPLVERAIYDPDLAIRHQALQGIQDDQKQLASNFAVPALRKSNNDVINRAAVVIGHMGDVRAVPALIEVLVTRHTMQVRVPIKNEISLINGPNGVQYVDPNNLSPYLPADIEISLRTGQLPWGVTVLPPSGAKATWRTFRVNAQLQNAHVLASLKELTGQDFGFDARSWKLWWAADSSRLLGQT